MEKVLRTPGMKVVTPGPMLSSFSDLCCRMAELVWWLNWCLLGYHCAWLKSLPWQLPFPDPSFCYTNSLLCNFVSFTRICRNCWVPCSPWTSLREPVLSDPLKLRCCILLCHIGCGHVCVVFLQAMPTEVCYLPTTASWWYWLSLAYQVIYTTPAKLLPNEESSGGMCLTSSPYFFPYFTMVKRVFYFTLSLWKALTLFSRVLSLMAQT